MDNTIRINGLTYDQWKLKLIQLIVDETIDLGSFLKLEEIKCVLSDDCDYPKSFIDGETPGIKVEELKYYADLIVDKMVEESRHHKAYWELYHWCKNHDVNKIDGFPYNSLRPYDTDWTKELRETVENIIKEKRPDLLEPKYSKPELLNALNVAKDLVKTIRYEHPDDEIAKEQSRIVDEALALFKEPEV